MFRCQYPGCGSLSRPGEKPVRRVVKVREVTYPIDVHHKGGGEGTEIVREEQWRWACIQEDGTHLPLEKARAV